LIQLGLLSEEDFAVITALLANTTPPIPDQPASHILADRSKLRLAVERRT
jgi:hypothetical protein